MTMTAPVPHVDYDGYRRVLASQAALSPDEWTFKRDPAYRQILEHVTQLQAVQFLDLAQREFPDEWGAVADLLPHLVDENDQYGRPIPELIPAFGICSPSNMRYLFHALLTLRAIDALEQGQIHIVELGGGYGGLALYVQRLQYLFKTRVTTYTIVDVPEACALQAAIAEQLGLSLRVFSGLGAEEMAKALLPDDGRQRFFVSAYGFAEFRAQFQEWYAERLIRHCQHGLLVWNYDPYWDNPVYQFVNVPLTVVPERPLTGPGNAFVSF